MAEANVAASHLLSGACGSSAASEPWRGDSEGVPPKRSRSRPTCPYGISSGQLGALPSRCSWDSVPAV
jgi:hypothetical protein